MVADDEIHHGDGEEARPSGQVQEGGASGDDDRPADWGAWLRTRLQQAAGLEAGRADEAGDSAEATAPTAAVEGRPPAPATTTVGDLGQEPDPAERPAEVAALPSSPDTEVAEELAALRAEVIIPGPETNRAEDLAGVTSPSGAVPHLAEGVGVAQAAAQPPGPDPGVTRGLVALRSAIDDVVDRLDALTAAIITQSAELGEKVDRQAAVTAERLDRALEAMAGQQAAVLGALGELVDRGGGDPDGDWRDSLQRLSSELTAGRTAAATQAAELADIGNRLDRLQEALDHLAAPSGADAAAGVALVPPPPPGDAALVELDDAQAATIAAAVAALLSDGTTASPPAPAEELPEPVAAVEEPSPPRPPPPRPRPRRRATPLRAATARPRAPSEDDAGATPAWHPGER